MIKFNFRAFRKKIDKFSIPHHCDLIEDKEVLESRVPIYLEKNLDKVKGVPFGIPLVDEFKEFNSSTYNSGPFYHYELNDLIIIKNRIYFEKYEYQLNPLEKTLRVYNSNNFEEYEKAAFSSMRISTVFFGHWLCEELILIDYLQGNENIVSSSPPTAQKKEIMTLFDLKYHATSFARIKSATMYEGWQHTKTYNDILRKYKEKISFLTLKQTSMRQKIVYLKRGKTASKRILENENKLLQMLSNNFDVKDFVAESTPITELYSAIYSADIILSIEGSQMAHAIIAGKPGSVLVCIQPPLRFYNPFKNYCSDAGLHYAVYVADQGLNKEGFIVDLDEFNCLLDKVFSLT